MKHRIAATALAALLATAGAASADDNDWVGLYKGLDALDGSIDTMSISTTGPGTFEIRTMPSVISLCESGRGWIVAQGRALDDNRLERHSARLFCEGSEPTSIRDLILVRDDETGVISFGATDDRRPLIYHRISTD